MQELECWFELSFLLHGCFQSSSELLFAKRAAVAERTRGEPAQVTAAARCFYLEVTLSSD